MEAKTDVGKQEGGKKTAGSPRGQENHPFPEPLHNKIQLKLQPLFRLLSWEYQFPLDSEPKSRLWLQQGMSGRMVVGLLQSTRVKLSLQMETNNRQEEGLGLATQDEGLCFQS